MQRLHQQHAGAAARPTAAPPQQEPPKRASSIPTTRVLQWQSHQLVGPPPGLPTELWGVQAVTQPAAAQVLLIPGNPGPAAFYRVLAAELHAACGGRVSVLAASHLGHDTSNLSRGRRWGLDAQVQHKRALLAELLAPGRPPTAIVAHSIGSHMALAALQQLLEQEQQQGEQQGEQQLPGLARVYLVQPFLAADFQGSSEQRVLAAVAQHAGGLMTAAARAVSGGPRWLQDATAHALMPGAEPHAAASLRAAFEPAAFANYWHLARDEFRSLNRPVDAAQLACLGRRVAVIHNPHDPWHPERHHRALTAALPDAEVHAVSGLSHAFCCVTDECRTVARIVQQSLAGAGEQRD